ATTLGRSWAVAGAAVTSKPINAASCPVFGAEVKNIVGSSCAERMEDIRLLFSAGPFGDGHRPVPRNFRLEVAETDPLRAPAQVHLRERYRAPVLGVCDRLAGVVENRGNHPVPRDVLVGTAHHVDVVLASPGPGQKRVAAPHGPGDHFGTAIG